MMFAGWRPIVLGLNDPPYVIVLCTLIFFRWITTGSVLVARCEAILGSKWFTHHVGIRRRVSRAIITISGRSSSAVEPQNTLRAVM
ncbi:hypothetical protein EDD22DRAFT_91189 [Suillus occidentalis]|nr:hypothetical protein EDD22DRAFT_91189 [Suillus occidentalis]